MQEQRLLKVEEVAVILGVSVKTINNWYWYRRENPDTELAQLLPDYQQERPTSARQWKLEDVDRLAEFKNHIVVGRKGHMGSITQKYVRKEKQHEVAQKV